MASSSLGYSSRLAISRTRPSCLFRTFSSTSSQREEVELVQSQPLNEIIPGSRAEEFELIKQGKVPIGSRRKRRAQHLTTQIPFEQLPYQCFQEARKILSQDREEKLQMIARMRTRIANVEARDASEFGGETQKTTKLYAMRRRLSDLKIYADVNDPMVKKTFEDGQADMNKPIYRYYAEKKWKEYKYKILVQRVEQMHIVPDLLPSIDIRADISMAFGRRKIPPGEFVDSQVSEQAPDLTVQTYAEGERKVAVAVIDADVPNFETDDFDPRCHFLATNIPLSPTHTSISLQNLAESQVVFPWLPPHAQKGSPYHRLAILVLERRGNEDLNAAQLREQFERHGFSARALVAKCHLKTLTATLFRTVWDENTTDVMQRANLPGAEVELKRKPGEALHWKYRAKNTDRYR